MSDIRCCEGALAFGALTAMLAALLGAGGCSNDRPSAPAARAARPAAVGESHLAGPGDDPDAVREEGEPCRYRVYVVPAGASADMSFVRPAPPGGESPGYEYREEGDALDGFSFGSPSVSYETAPVTYPTWLLDGQDLFAAVRAEPSYDAQREWGGGGGIPYNIPIGHSVGGTTIRWREDGFAVLESVPGAHGRQAVGRLDEDALSGKLGNGPPPFLPYYVQWMGRTFDLAATRGEETEDRVFEHLDLSVTVPDGLDNLRTDVGTAHFLRTDGHGTGFGLAVGAAWGFGRDPGRVYFKLRGPAIGPDCP